MSSLERLRSLPRVCKPSNWNRINIPTSKSQFRLAKERKQRPASINVAESLSRLQQGSSAGQHDVFCQRRAILHAHACVFADIVANGRGKQNIFERLGAHESQIIKVQKAFQLRRDIDVRACIDQEDSRIHEIRLTFFFVRTHVRQQTAIGGQRNAGPGQTNRLAVPETENSSRKIGQVHNGIEAVGTPAAGVVITRSVKRGNAVTNPVAIVGKFHGSHLAVDGNTPASNRIEAILARRFIKRVRQIQALDMSAAEPSEIANLDAMENRSGSLVDDVADGRWAHKESVVVIM